MPARAGHSENVPEAAIAEQERFRVRLMGEGDLPAIVRVDGQRGGSHTAFHAEKLTACLREPGINTSLVAEADGVVVGFLMGRLFFGEFGVPLTRAVLDWMAVLPAFAHQGAAHALFEQYVRNMRGLGVEAIDTLVDFALTSGFERLLEGNFEVPDGEVVKVFAVTVLCQERLEAQVLVCDLVKDRLSFSVCHETILP